MCPPHSPTRITKNSILKLAGAFHSPNTSRIRFWAFSYSMGEPCGRSNQLITYFIGILLIVLVSERLQFGRANVNYADPCINRPGPVYAEAKVQTEPRTPRLLRAER